MKTRALFARYADQLRVVRTLLAAVTHVHDLMAATAKKFDCPGRDPRVREEPHYLAGGIE
jgi:hypothetical protein